MTLTARPYQSEAVAAVGEAFRTHRSTLVVMATGLGKTVTFSLLAQQPEWERVLVLAHRRELVEQAAKTLARTCGEHHVGIDMADERNRNRRVVCASVQSLAAGRIKAYDPREKWLVIVDEGHHATAVSYRKIMQWFGVSGTPEMPCHAESRLLLVTATPKRGDDEALGQICESVAYEYPIHKAIKDGWLCPVETKTVKILGLDFSTVRTTCGDLNEADLERILTEEGPSHGIAQETAKWSNGRKTLVFCVSVQHAKTMAEVINRYAGQGAAAYLSGETHDDERAAVTQRFKSGDLKYLCNCNLFLEGFDAPETACVAMARPTKSVSLYAQVLGRGTRPLPGTIDAPGMDTPADRRAAIKFSAKPSMTMLDFVGQAHRHDLVSCVDVLGGESTLEEIRLADAFAKSREELGVDALEALETARLARESQAIVKAVEEEWKRELASRRRSHIKADRVAAVVEDVDTFGGATRGRSGPSGEGLAVAKEPLSEAQYRYLVRLGCDPAVARNYGKRQAGVVIERLKSKRVTQ